MYDSSDYPGLAGALPHFQLSNGSVTLRPHESDRSHLANRYLRERRWSPSQLAFQVGEALELTLQQGDTLLLSYSETCDFGISLLRDDKLVLALGDVFTMPLGTEVKLANDPRMRHHRLWHEIAVGLRNPNTRLVWIHPQDGDLASWKARLEGYSTGHHLIVAVREPGHELRTAIRKILPKGSSFSLTSVNPSFADEKAWRATLDTVAGGPPNDPYVSVYIRGRETHLREGQKAYSESYLLHLARYFDDHPDGGIRDPCDSAAIPMPNRRYYHPILWSHS